MRNSTCKVNLQDQISTSNIAQIWRNHWRWLLQRPLGIWSTKESLGTSRMYWIHPCTTHVPRGSSGERDNVHFWRTQWKWRWPRRSWRLLDLKTSLVYIPKYGTLAITSIRPLNVYSWRSNIRYWRTTKFSARGTGRVQVHVHSGYIQNSVSPRWDIA